MSSEGVHGICMLTQCSSRCRYAAVLIRSRESKRVAISCDPSRSKRQCSLGVPHEAGAAPLPTGMMLVADPCRWQKSGYPWVIVLTVSMGTRRGPATFDSSYPDKSRVDGYYFMVPCEYSTTDDRGFVQLKRPAMRPAPTRGRGLATHPTQRVNDTARRGYKKSVKSDNQLIPSSSYGPS